jgi:hypothetical protein
MLPEHQPVRDDRRAQHQAAVRHSLGWADAAARAGDHADLHWLDVVEAVGHELSAELLGGSVPGETAPRPCPLQGLLARAA